MNRVYEEPSSGIVHVWFMKCSRMAKTNVPEARKIPPKRKSLKYFLKSHHETSDLLYGYLGMQRWI